MSAAYVDTSFVLSIIFGESRAPGLRAALRRHRTLLAGDLLVAEALSAAAREGVAPGAVWASIEAISIVLPDRTLGREIGEVLAHGYLRGADLWHVACAMFVAGDARSELTFLTRDAAQRRVARRVGFRVD